jgi:hypothetical protein
MFSDKRISLLALFPLFASAQECPGTTYRSLCCHGTLVGSSVALPPASTFSLGTPPPYTASNNYHLSDFTHAMPSDIASIITNPAAFSSYEAEVASRHTDSAGLASLSHKFESLISQAATETNVYSILPISAGGFQKRASTTESVITAGVTCRGSVSTLASNTASQTSTASGSEPSTSASKRSSSTSSPAPTSAPASTSAAAKSSAVASSSSSSVSSVAASSTLSAGAGAGAGVGAAQKVGAVLGPALGLALGIL